MGTGNGIDVLTVRVDKIESDLKELKSDIKEEFKEMNARLQKNEDFLNENILFLRENLAELSTIAKGHEVILNNLNKPKDDEEKTWYRKMLMDNHKWLWFLVAIVIGTVLGGKFSDIVSVFSHIVK